MAVDALIYGGAAVVVAGNLGATFVKNARVARWTFWSSWLLGIIAMALPLLDRGWQTTAGSMAAAFLIAVLIAYLRTPYLVIRGRVYSYRYRKPKPTDYDGRVSAAQLWWTLAVFAAGEAFLIHLYGMHKSTLGGGAFLTAMLGAFGHIDRRAGFPVARKQYVPFAIVCLASIPAFLLPLAGYGVGYYWLTGKPVEDEDDATD